MVRGQAIADFLLQLRMGSGIRIQILTPDGTQLTNSIILDFTASNNEAVLARIRMVIALQVKFLKVFNDSKLVVDWVKGFMLTKDTRMIAYKALVLDTAKNFQDIVFMNVL